ncbi:unnamed protein product [Adineta steineri]|uniref:TIR domain-containing protein n=1 Tax=Adineta steineri TaxID=433720 RepID=A0A813S3W7_9BILA|nr:unnamed protein product [Adineta steineri]CAF0892887.1 unnamed protein product [Adineta steineri]
MSHSKESKDLSSSTSSLSSFSSKHNGLALSSNDIKAKLKGLFHRHSRGDANLAQVVICKRFAKVPMLFLAKRRQRRKISIENNDNSYTDDNAGIMALSSSGKLSFEQVPETFEDYTQKLEEALVLLRNMTREDYESEITLKILRFLENLIHQPKEWISGAKLKLSEMKFPEMAMTLMNSYKEKGYLVRRIVFVHSILLYNSMSNFTDHEFDKEGLIRKQSADAGFIEFGCDILNDPSYRESLRKCYVIQSPEETMQSDDFNNYQKILYICDSALTILYNLANLPELKIHFRECNAMTIIAEFTKLPTNTIQIQFPEITDNEEYILSIKELQDVASAIRVTSCLLLPLIMNEDEDNLLATNTSEVLPLLSGMIQMYNRNDQRFYGFSFIELVDGLSKLMVRGRTHTFIDQNLVNLLLNILEHSTQDNSLLECVSNAILNAAFDERVQKFLDSDHAINVIRSTKHSSQSQLVKKNCEAILWTLNRIPHKCSSTISNSCKLQGHIMISYNRSVTAMCLKIRDRLKSLHYNVWLDVDNINGGVLESMAQAVENSSIVLICMNEQYKQSYYCRLEAEYATELRKPCIPCLMQPRFRPYGWLGIIKGAKIHVDFATSPFEEAFALLIREIETIRRDIMMKNNNNTQDKTPPPLYHQPSIGYSPIYNSNTIDGNSLEFKNKQRNVNINNPILDWNVNLVQQWLVRIGLSHLENVFTNIDGKLLCKLYQMKQLAADSYYSFLAKHFDRLEIIHMSDTLKFDYELECLFQ